MRSLFFLSLCFLFLFGVNEKIQSETIQKQIYIKPRTITTERQIRLSSFTNWKNEFDPILYTDLQTPKAITPIELSDLLTSKQKELQRPNESTFIQFEVLGKEGKILPKSKKITAFELEKTLKAYLLEIGIPLDHLRIHSSNRDITVIEGTEVRFRKMGKTIHGGKRLFPLDMYFEGKLVYSEPVAFEIEEKKSAYFTKVEIPTKQVITEEDIELREFYTSDHNREFVEESPVGKTALNVLLEDKPIEKKQIRLLHTVERGSEVSLVFTTGNILLKVKARALASGNVGDRIPLLNSISQKKIEGVVQKEGICLLDDRI